MYIIKLKQYEKLLKTQEKICGLRFEILFNIVLSFL